MFSEHLLRVNYGLKQGKIKFDPHRFSVGELGKKRSQDHQKCQERLSLGVK